jgi:hypothetical protein
MLLSVAARDAPCPAVWQLAHDLHAHDELIQEWSAGPVFERLQRSQIVRIQIEAVSLDTHHRQDPPP